MIPLFAVSLALLTLSATPSAAANKCVPVSLAVSGAKPFTKVFVRGSPALKKMPANFAQAYARACAEGLLKAKPLTASGRLFLLNAPDANVASIYRSSGRTLLEFPFLGGDGRTDIPDAKELHEAIYCAVHGASAKEQQESGRCLPD
jgi:hypothetical protein